MKGPFRAISELQGLTGVTAILDRALFTTPPASNSLGKACDPPNVFLREGALLARLLLQAYRELASAGALGSV